MKIGITGHQRLPSGLGFKWLKKSLTTSAKSVENVTCAFSSLAIGADQLFAKIIISMQIDLIAVIPCKSYENTFKKHQQKQYFKLRSECKQIKTLDFAEPSETAFYAAGKYVVINSDVLFAIWDGNQAKGLGGTGDIVEYALSLNKSVIHLNPISKQIIIHK